ncbi:MAG: Asp/Glu/hydantoin racemase [Kiritimatiellaeota bacterium]|nr:Asp/Glu/hydantoin racemase [Kiritimatiellota bacterium]
MNALKGDPRPVIALLHTVPGVVRELDELFSCLVPEATPFHLLGEGLLDLVAAAGGVSPEVEERVFEQVRIGRDIGAAAVLITCSSIGACAESACRVVSFPVFRIDVPMADEAVRTGRRIAVLATTRTTLAPTEALLRERARRAGRDVDLDVRLCELPKATTGVDPVAVRDAALLEVIRDAAAGGVAAIVLAQASMAGVLERNTVVVDCPVFSSPRSGLLQVKAWLDAGRPPPSGA